MCSAEWFETLKPLQNCNFFGYKNNYRRYVLVCLLLVMAGDRSSLIYEGYGLKNFIVSVSEH